MPGGGTGRSEHTPKTMSCVFFHTHQSPKSRTPGVTAEEEGKKGCLQRVGSPTPCPQKAPLSWRQPGPSQLAPLLAGDAASLVPIATPTPFSSTCSQEVPQDLAGRPGPQDRCPPAGSPGDPRRWDSPGLPVSHLLLRMGAPRVQVTISKVPPLPQPRRRTPSCKDGSCSNHTESCTWTPDTGNVRETKGPGTE